MILLKLITVALFIFKLVIVALSLLVGFKFASLLGKSINPHAEAKYYDTENKRRSINHNDSDEMTFMNDC